MSAVAQRAGGETPPALIPKAEFPFAGLDNLMGRKHPRYPFYAYKDGCDPLRIEDTEAEEKARADGYDNVTAASMSNKQLVNWFWDLEDMSPKQLVVFARDEYGVDLPAEADQDTLFKAVVELTRHAPQNRNRLVLMAHEITMEYDATLDEIRRMVASPNGKGLETETATFEVVM